MIIAVDFDQTLHDCYHPRSGGTMGPPIEGAREAMLILKAKGHNLIIHTVRGNKPGHVRNWLNYFKIPFDSVTNIKPPADLFIDDRAVRFTNWKDMIDFVEEASK